MAVSSNKLLTDAGGWSASDRNAPREREAAVASGAEVHLERLTKRFGGTTAVDDVTLAIPAGSFVTLLGPSGSGKTTTLNLIAGFIAPDSGDIRFDHRTVAAIPPHRRNIGMVFQSYALFPHMTVFENVAYPLRMREKLGREAMRQRVGETLALVQLAGFEGRYPRQLSGGQQQRVAMARALVSRPRLLLMDEPLGALDKKLREQLQIEIKQIHRQIGSTFVYVTHDQSEALTMSDLVVVMNNSRVAQVGPPRALYEAPTSEFVADFLGGANLLPAEMVASDGGTCDVRIASGHVLRIAAPESPVAPGRRVSVFIRPEDIAVANPLGGRAEGIKGVVQDMLYLGDALRLVVTVGQLAISVRAPRSQLDDLAPGRTVALSWASDRARVLVPDPGQ